jgi:hypothetical protein
MERAVAEKAKVIVINGTGEDGDYGLDTVSSGVYRYSADDQAYLIVLNVTGTSAHFQSGMNTIILPRAIALKCQLNDTLYNLQNIGTSPLNGASFYSTDPLKTTASGHIIAVISKNVTASQAETILTMLTHNSTGARIGNNVTISPTALYLLHLPNDILSAIPTSVMNSGMGEGPNYYSLGSVIGDIAGMVFDFLVWVATGGVLLLLAHLVKEGLKAIGNLASDLWDEVQDAVDAIVDAFWAFVEWALKFIQELAASFFSPLIDPIVNCIDKYYAGIATAGSSIENDLNTEGSISSESIHMMVDAILGDLFWIMLGVISITALILSVFSIATGGLSFITTLALNVLISTLVLTIFGVINVLTSDSGSCPGSVFYDFMMDKVADYGGDITPGGLLQAGISCLCAVVDILISANLAMSMGIPDFIANGAAIGFSLGILGLGFCAIGSITNSAMFQMTSLVMSGFGFYSLFTYRRSLTISNMLGSVSAKQITTVGMVVSSCGILTSLASLSQEDWFN